MDIQYLGHSSFKLKGKQGTVITDPFDGKMTGFAFPSASADIVTVSHQHPDHNFTQGVSGTARSEKPWVINTAGEYEIAGISVFGYEAYHDDKKGEERGKNIVFAIVIDGIRIVHLGDIGHELTDSFIEELGTIDVLLCPVGGKFTIDASAATEIIAALEPSYVIPMHYKTDKHGAQFADVATLADFEKVYGITSEPVKSLSVSSGSMPDQTNMVVLSA